MVRLVLKICIASVLIYWLISTGKLDFTALDIFWENPAILSYNFFFWLAGSTVLCSFRWRALVRGTGFFISAIQSVRLNMIGMFFNTIMPGVVGGDVIKAIYICKGQPGEAKIPIFLSIILDRVIGLLALFTLSAVAILFNFNAVYKNVMLRPFIALSFSVLIGVSCLVLLAMIPQEKRDKMSLIRWVFRLIVRIRFLRQIYDAMRSYKDHPWFVLQAFSIAVVHQAMFVLLYFMVSSVLLPESIPFGILMTILPIGIVTTALPLTPGGLGVGHLAFEKLYQLAGVESGGANVFNIVFFGQLSLNLLGLIPYLFLRNELAPLIKSSGHENCQGC